ncbi:MAG: TonB C-terminal domain-containing protein, partial [Candidatus Pseudothioglobus sp.]
AYEREQYTQLLNQEIQEDKSSELMQQIEDQEARLQSAWIRNIAAEVKSVWNFPGAEDGWFVKVLVTQDREGKVLNVKSGDNNVGNSVIAKRFIDSVERAIYKSSPLPISPDASVWQKDILFTFYP